MTNNKYWLENDCLKWLGKLLDLAMDKIKTAQSTLATKHISTQTDKQRLMEDNNIETQLIPEAPVWLPNQENCWVKAVILTVAPAKHSQSLKLRCQIEDSEQVVEEEFSVNSIALRNTTLNEDRLDDLTGLSYLTEPALLHTIRIRYFDNSIYTYSGLVLVSLNPYCDLNLYGDTLIQAYSGKESRGGELEPHLFAVAEDAFRALQRNQQNQSIIISGESGAGKTISAKYVMRYFASAAATITTAAPTSNVEAKVLASNPLLEAFGNAKTVRNDNSSRFGKYVQIFFNARNEIIGAVIKTYLLEKTRIITAARGERSYHIFYQLISGAQQQESMNCLHLKGKTWRDFDYLKESGTGEIGQISDLQEFQITCEALDTAGFSKPLQLALFKVLSAILHLGNLDFELEGGSTSALNVMDSNLKIVCELLGADGEDLVHSLTAKLLVTRVDSVEMKLNVKQAEQARDALAKFLYSRLFDFIVDHLNQILTPSSQFDRFIGVLDIYGFERFENNSFEQFCINYANEKLQHEFNQQVFKLEQELYEREQISWSFINFADNQPCIDMIEARGGILDLLDEECKFPRGSDASFLQKLKSEVGKKTAGKQQHQAAFLLQDPLQAVGTFTIKHFAYDVAYGVEGFLDKNCDLVPLEALASLNSTAAATSEVMAALLEGEGKALHKFTTGSGFRDSLRDLMKIIQSTQVHYIRCIKPNNSKSPSTFEAPFVLQQLRAGGIIETIKISAAGYPARWSFEEFHHRYSLLLNRVNCGSTDQSKTADSRQLAEDLLSQLTDLTNEQYQIGRTKIFLRAGIVAELEKKRSGRIKAAASLIQNSLRARLIQAEISKQLKLIKTIQATTRRLLAQKQLETVQKLWAHEVIGAAFRRALVQDQVRQAKSAIKLIQAIFLAHLNQSIKIRQRKEFMAKRIQDVFRAKKPLLVNNFRSYAITMLQNSFRRRSSLSVLKKLRREHKSLEKMQKASLGLEQKIIDLTNDLEAAKMSNKELESKLFASRAENEEIASLQDKVKSMEIEHIAWANQDARNVELRRELADKEAELARNQQQIKDLQRDIEELKSLHASGQKKLQETQETKLKNAQDTHEQKLKELQEKFDRQAEEKRRLELKFSKVEHYVRSLMTNQIVTTADFGVTANDCSSGTEDDPMASQNSLLNFIKDEDDAKLIKFTSNNQLLEDLLRSESVLNELIFVIKSAAIEDGCDEIVDQDALLQPAKLLYSWISLSVEMSSLQELTEFRALRLIEEIRGALSESTDDAKCALWMTNLIQLYGMIHHLVLSKESSLQAKITGNCAGPSSIASTPTQVSLSQIAPPVLLLVRAELMKLIEDIYTAWLRELCRWFGRAGVAAILDHQALPNYKVRSSRPRASKFLEVVISTFTSAPESSASTSSNSAMSIDEFLGSLDELLAALKVTTLDAEINQQLLKVIFEHLSVTCFNQLFLRREFISWKRAIQIQYNLTRLEEWIHAELSDFGLVESVITELFDPLLQSVKVIQLAKTSGADAATLQQCARSLNEVQIRKLLTNYVPDEFEDGPVPSSLLQQFGQQPHPQSQQMLLLPPLEAAKFDLQVVLRDRAPPNSPNSLAASLPLNIPPTLWKLFVLYLK